MTVFIYVLIRISFQTGDSSSRITQSLAYKVGVHVFNEQPSVEQLSAINRLLRYGAHLALFALLGFGLGILFFLISRRSLTRLLSILLDWAVTFGLSYFTEYFKKFIPGRHFQMDDVRVNMIGSLFGICFFLVSLVLFEVIHSRRIKSE